MKLALAAVVVLGFFTFAPAVAAQGICTPSGGVAATTNAWEVLTKRVEIRQNTNVKRDIAQPAFITFTNPVEGASTYQIGVDVLASVCPGTGFDVDALVDYQRNTAIDKKQDSFKTGLTGYWRPQDLVASHNAALISFRTNFKNDGVKNNRGWQNAVGYTHLFAGQHAFRFLIFRFDLEILSEVVWQRSR